MYVSCDSEVWIKKFVFIISHHNLRNDQLVRDEDRRFCVAMTLNKR
jgi:hypothetical protein